VKSGRPFARRQHADLGRQLGVEGADQRWRIDRPFERERGDLAERMDAGIGAPGARDRNVTILEFAQRRFEQTLNRGPDRLPLPADVIGPVVGENDCERRHRLQPQAGRRNPDMSRHHRA
jgi:hypothetical protein